MKRFWLLLLSLLLCFSLSGCSLLWMLPSPGPATIPEDLYPYEPDDHSYGYYYDQLTEESRAVYRAILKNKESTASTEIILPATIVLSFPKDTAEEAIKAKISERILSVTQPAIDALLYDNPEIFYLSMGGENSSRFSVTHRTQQETDGVSVYMRKLSFIMQTENVLPTRTLAEEIDDLQTALDHFEIVGENRYERLLSIHRELASHVSYDGNGVRPHCAAGALIDGRAVCDGYAKAFYLLCEREGIPCVIVAGVAKQGEKSEPHAWNYVQMEDELWYGVDTTWDDVGHTAIRDYFLVGAKESSFLETHIPSGKFSEGDHPPFTAPTLSDSDYVPA